MSTLHTPSSKSNSHTHTTIDPLLRTAVPLTTPTRNVGKGKGNVGTQDHEPLGALQSPSKQDRDRDDKVSAGGRIKPPKDDYYVPRQLSPHWDGVKDNDEREGERERGGSSDVSSNPASSSVLVNVPRPREEYFVPRGSTDGSWREAQPSRAMLESRLEDMTKRVQTAEAERDELSETMSKQYVEWHARQESMDAQLSRYQELEEENQRLHGVIVELEASLEQNVESKGFFEQIEAELADLDNSLKAKLNAKEREVEELNEECSKLRELVSLLEERLLQNESGRASSEKDAEEEMRNMRIASAQEQETLREAQRNISKLETDLAKEKASSTQRRAIVSRLENNVQQYKADKERMEAMVTDLEQKLHEAERSIRDSEMKQSRINRDWRKRVQRLREDNGELSLEIEKFKDEQQKLKERIKRSKKAEQDANTLVISRNEEISALSRQLEDEHRHLNSDMREKTRRISHLENELSTAETSLIAVRQELQEKSKLYELIQGEKERVVMEYDDISKKHDGCTAKINDLESILKSEKERISSLQHQLDTIRSEFDVYKRRKELEIDEISRMKQNEHEKFEEFRDAHVGEISDLQTVISRKDAALTEAAESVSQLSSACESLRAEIGVNRVTIATEEARRSDIEVKYTKLEERCLKLEERSREADTLELSLKQCREDHVRENEEWKAYMEKMKEDHERESDAQQRLNDQHSTAIERRLHESEGELNTQKGLLQRLEQEIRDLSATKRALEDSLASAQVRIDQLENAVSRAETEKKEIEEHSNKVNVGLSTVQTESNEIIRRNKRLLEENSRLNSRIRSLSEERDSLSKNASQLQKRLSALETKHRLENEHEVELARQIKANYDSEAAKFENKLKIYTRKFNSLENELTLQIEACEDANNRASRAEEERDRLIMMLGEKEKEREGENDDDDRYHYHEAQSEAPSHSPPSMSVFSPTRTHTRTSIGVGPTAMSDSVEHENEEEENENGPEKKENEEEKENGAELSLRERMRIAQAEVQRLSTQAKQEQF